MESKALQIRFKTICFRSVIVTDQVVGVTVLAFSRQSFTMFIATEEFQQLAQHLLALTVIAVVFAAIMSSSS